MLCDDDNDKDEHKGSKAVNENGPPHRIAEPAVVSCVAWSASSTGWVLRERIPNAVIR